MKIILDHCLPRRICRQLANHQVKTTADQGWEKLRNGKLLAAAALEFDVFLTIDKNLKHQQNLITLPIAVIVLLAKTNRLADLLPFVPLIETELGHLNPRTLIELDVP